MLAVKRHQMILKYLEEHTTATTKQLSELTNASLATLRRDLNVLDQQGCIKKTHGGAQTVSVPTVSVPSLSALNLQEKQVHPTLQHDPWISYKDSIAKKAAELVHSGDIIFIGAGMTCNLLCRYINEKQPEHLTVVTTNVTAVTELAPNLNISTLLLGGNIHAGTNHIETLDEYTVQSLEQLYFDKVFITVDGIDLNCGYSIINRAQLPLYNHLLLNSRELYLLANNGKFDKRTFTHFCSMEEIPYVITNASIPEAYLKYYREHEITVLLADEKNQP